MTEGNNLADWSHFSLITSLKWAPSAAWQPAVFPSSTHFTRIISPVSLSLQTSNTLSSSSRTLGWQLHFPLHWENLSNQKNLHKLLLSHLHLSTLMSITLNLPICYYKLLWTVHLLPKASLSSLHYIPSPRACSMTLLLYQFFFSTEEYKHDAISPTETQTTPFDPTSKSNYSSISVPLHNKIP